MVPSDTPSASAISRTRSPGCFRNNSISNWRRSYAVKARSPYRELTKLAEFNNYIINNLLFIVKYLLESTKFIKFLRDHWLPFIFALAVQGTTIFVTTHSMHEAEHCNRVGFMDRGKLLAYDTPWR